MPSRPRTGRSRDGQQAALSSLLKRLVPVTAYARIRKLSTAMGRRPDRGLQGALRAQFGHRLHRQPRLLVPGQGHARPAAARGPRLHRRAGPGAQRHSLSPARDSCGRRWQSDAAWTNMLERPRHRARADAGQAARRSRRMSAPEAVNALANGDGNAMRAMRSLAYGSELRAPRRGRARRCGRPPQRYAQLAAMRSGPLLDCAPIASTRADPAYARELAAVVSLGILRRGAGKTIKSRSDWPRRRPRADRPADRGGVSRHERVAGYQPQASRDARASRSWRSPAFPRAARASRCAMPKVPSAWPKN